MKVIAAFSSDSRPQYKADIYKAMCLSEGDVIHFRYKKKHVQDLLVNKQIWQMLEGRKVVIFLSQGNDANSPKGVDELTHVSTREANILSCDWIPETELYHVRMKLGRFINAEIKGLTIRDKFFQEVDIEEKQERNNWKSRVEELRPSFNDVIFFNIKGVFDSKGNNVGSTYNTQSYSRVYNLYHGERYTIKMHLANFGDIKRKLSIDYNHDDIVISYPNPIESSVEFDDVFIPLNVKISSVFKHSNFITFKPVEGYDLTSEANTAHDIFKVSQEFVLKINFRSASIFGLLSLIAFAAAMVSSAKEGFDIFPFFKYLVAGVFVFISTSGLFYFFNKK